MLSVEDGVALTLPVANQFYYFLMIMNEAGENFGFIFGGRGEIVKLNNVDVECVSI